MVLLDDVIEVLVLTQFDVNAHGALTLSMAAELAPLLPMVIFFGTSCRLMTAPENVVPQPGPAWR